MSVTRISSPAEAKPDSTVVSSLPGKFVLVNTAGEPIPAPDDTQAKRVLFSDDASSTTAMLLATAKRPKKSILKKAVKNSLAARAENDLNASKETLLADIYNSIIDFSTITDVDTVFKIACEALDNNEPGKQLEIYAALNSALRSPNSIASTQMLMEHANKLAHNAKRDLLAAESSSDPLELRVINQILRVIDYLFFAEDVAMSLEFDLAKWFMVHGLEALENHDTSKANMSVYLHIFNFQRLPRPLGADFFSRLLTAVINRPDFASSNVISEYIGAYRMLLKHAPNVMVAQVQDWMPEVVRFLVEPNFMIRRRALTVIQDCGVNFAGQSRASLAKSFATALNQPIVVENEFIGSPRKNRERQEQQLERQSQQSRALIDELIDHLQSSFSIPDDGKLSMTTWSTTILLLSNTGTIDKWPHLDAMLSLYKEGLNSGNTEAQLQGILNWRTMICIWTEVPFYRYSIPQQQQALKRRTSVLVTPFVMIKSAKLELSETATHVFLKLLYASNPNITDVNMSNMQSTIVWNKIIVPVMKIYLSVANNNLKAIEHAANILSHLLKPNFLIKPGNDSDRREKILSQDSISLAEIPPLPAKWIHQHAKLVLELIGLFVEKAPWKFTKEIWLGFLASVRSVSQREIQVSSETMDVVAQLSNFIGKYCNQECESPSSLEKIGFILKSSLEKVGLIPFTDKPLTAGKDNNNLQLISLSPKSNRALTKSLDVETSSPLVHIVKMLGETWTAKLKSSNEELLEAYDILIREILTYMSDRMRQGKKALTFLAKCIGVLHDCVNPGLWVAITEVAIATTSKDDKPAQLEDVEEILLSYFGMVADKFDSTFEFWKKLLWTLPNGDKLYATAEKNILKLKVDGYPMELTKFVAYHMWRSEKLYTFLKNDNELTEFELLTKTLTKADSMFHEKIFYSIMALDAVRGVFLFLNENFNLDGVAKVEDVLVDFLDSFVRSVSSPHTSWRAKEIPRLMAVPYEVVRALGRLQFTSEKLSQKSVISRFVHAGFGNQKYNADLWLATETAKFWNWTVKEKLLPFEDYDVDFAKKAQVMNENLQLELPERPIVNQEITPSPSPNKRAPEADESPLANKGSKRKKRRTRSKSTNPKKPESQENATPMSSEKEKNHVLEIPQSPEFTCEDMIQDPIEEISFSQDDNSGVGIAITDVESVIQMDTVPDSIEVSKSAGESNNHEATRIFVDKWEESTQSGEFDRDPLSAQDYHTTAASELPENSATENQSNDQLDSVSATDRESEIVIQQENEAVIFVEKAFLQSPRRSQTVLVHERGNISNNRPKSNQNVFIGSIQNITGPQYPLPPQPNYAYSPMYPQHYYPPPPMSPYYPFPPPPPPPPQAAYASPSPILQHNLLYPSAGPFYTSQAQVPPPPFYYGPVAHPSQPVFTSIPTAAASPERTPSKLKPTGNNTNEKRKSQETHTANEATSEGLVDEEVSIHIDGTSNDRNDQEDSSSASNGSPDKSTVLNGLFKKWWSSSPRNSPAPSANNSATNTPASERRLRSGRSQSEDRSLEKALSSEKENSAEKEISTSGKKRKRAEKTPAAQKKRKNSSGEAIISGKNLLTLLKQVNWDEDEFFSGMEDEEYTELNRELVKVLYKTQTKQS